MSKLRGYIFSRPFLGERAPQHIQNIILRDYCAKRKFTFLLSATEYAMEGSNLILNQIVDNIDDVDGIVAYSLFQLPEDYFERIKIISKVLGKSKSLHFAVEGLIIDNDQSYQRCEMLWKLKKAEESSLKEL
jgi:sporadic carbohydrate cluster protein (TIGR04323 family)